MDFTKFPAFNFVDADLEPVGVQVEIKAAADLELAEGGKKAEEDDKAYFEP